MESVIVLSLPWASCSDNAALAGRIEIENIYIVFQSFLFCLDFKQSELLSCIEIICHATV